MEMQQRVYGSPNGRIHNVLVIEPDGTLASSIENTLRRIQQRDHPEQEDYFFVNQVANAQAAQRLFPSEIQSETTPSQIISMPTHWDMVLLRLNLPQTDSDGERHETGLATLEQILRANPDQEVYVMADHDQEQVVDAALSAGAKYFLKDPTNELRFGKLVNLALSAIDSSIDPLTGLLSRRAFYERSQQAFERLKSTLEQTAASRRKKVQDDYLKTSIAFLDLDLFKGINDTYGHLAGDAVLRYVGHVIKNSALRRGDLAARFGGDEYVFRFDNITHLNSVIATRRLARMITDVNYADIVRSVAPEANIPPNLVLGASGGVATYDAPNGSVKTIDDLIGKSDEAMYLAKEHRKTRIKAGGVMAFAVYGYTRAEATPEKPEPAEVPTNSSLFVG